MRRLAAFTVRGAKKVEITSSPGRGRGVFATKRIKDGETIEMCPALIFEASAWNAVERSPFGHYPFAWGTDGAVALGVTSLCNHKEEANAEVVLWKKEGALELVAITAIKKGEEVFINYGPKLWFTPG